MTRLRVSITSVSAAFILAACGSSPSTPGTSSQGGGGGAQTGGSGTTNSSGTTGGANGGNSTGGANGGNSTGGANGGNNTGGANGGNNTGGANGGNNTGGNNTGGVVTTGGAQGTATGGKAATGGSASTSTGGKSATGGAGTGGTPSTSTGGKPATGGTGAVTTGGSSGTGGGTSASTTAASSSLCYTSAAGNYWKTAALTPVTTGTADVTVNDASASQTWDGFGGAFNELGWTVLTSSTAKTQAMNLLFSCTDGACFSWGRIPIGASDYATSRYTEDDTTTPADPTVNGETGRPAADTALAKFNMANGHDDTNLVPYIQAAQAVKSDIRFWASPWTAPVWMKTGWDTTAGGSGTAKRASYFDGGSMNGTTNLAAYAQYYAKFVQYYQSKNINIEIVSPQNEPGYEQNYPSCLWDSATYVSWVKTLGAAMAALTPSVKLMLGTMSNNGDSSGGKVRKDTDIAAAVLADSTAAGYLKVAGVQWGVLDAVNGGSTAFGSLPIWATETKCGNYPWITSDQAASTNAPAIAKYNSSAAPNDIAYAVEQWWYIRNAITKGKVTAYNAWNMILDSSGLGNDTSRDWKQDALLVASGGSVTATPAYYVFRHFSQYVTPGAKVVATSGGDAVAFKNPDNSLVVAMYNSGAAKTSIVSIGGKLFSFAMPAAGWATVKYAP